MPTVLRVGPYRFFFFSNEGDEPPHSRAARPRAREVLLEPVALAESANFPAHELGTLRGLVVENHAKLIEAWHEYFSR